MGMNGNQMGDEVVAAIKAISGGSYPQDAHVRQIWEAICSAIVLHIQTNAVVKQAPDSDGDTEQDGNII